MATKINISIPEPCHENWQNMSVIEKERFCDLCQKKVYDFTYASDREIIAAYNKNNKLCGRFTTSQLNRDLVLPKEKSSIWLATTSAIVSFIGLGTHEVFAQEKSATEQTDKKISSSDNLIKTKVKIEGQIIFDELEKPSFEDIDIIVFGENKKFNPDKFGCFSFEANKDDYVIFSKNGYDNTEFKIENLPKFCHIEIVKDNCRVSIGGAVSIIKKRTFFGRIFHSIEKWFK